jgi:hypothetical protein
VELAPPIAFADAEIEAAVRQQVESRGLFGEQCRVVPRQHQHRGAEPQRRCLRRQIGQEVEGRRDLAETSEMVLDQEHAVKAERLGLADIVDVVAVDLAVGCLLARVGARAAEQSEPHAMLSSEFVTRAEAVPGACPGREPRATAEYSTLDTAFAGDGRPGRELMDGQARELGVPWRRLWVVVFGPSLTRARTAR